MTVERKVFPRPRTFGPRVALGLGETFLTLGSSRTLLWPTDKKGPKHVLAAPKVSGFTLIVVLWPVLCLLQQTRDMA